MAKFKSIHTGPQIDSGVSRALNPDTVPTAGSSNLMTSGGVKSAITHDLANIVATGSTNNTGATITAGTYFYLNGTLVRAKADIAVNATFTSGTNYETVTAGGLNSLMSALTPSLWYSQEFSADALPKNVPLPSGWKMLFVAVYVDASYRGYTFAIPRDFLWNTGAISDDGFTIGYYVTSSDFGRASIQIPPDGSTISVNDTNAGHTWNMKGKLIVSYI